MERDPEERQAFEALVLRYQHAVCAMAYAVLHDRARSEEVAQEAFLVAWQKSPAPAITAAWICGVARNLARNAARRRTEVTMAEDPVVPAVGDNPREALLAREAATLAAAALAELPESYREAVVLYYRGDESMAEVAAALGVSPATAKQRVHRGRERLRTALSQVERTLRQTRPGAAFTAGVVAVWLTRGPTAEAAAIGSQPAPRVATGLWRSRMPLLVGGALAVATVATVTTVTGVLDRAPAGRDARVGTSLQPGATARPAATALQVTARFPATPSTRRAVPAARVALIAPPSPASTSARAQEPINIDFMQANVDDLFHLLADVMDAPILADPPIDDRVDLRAEDRPAIEVLDQLVAAVHAERTEVPAIRLLMDGGRVDAGTLGGPLITLHLKDAPLDDVLALIETPLQMPIGRIVPRGPINGVEVPQPHVSIDVDEVPAGVALEKVLIETGLGYELTTGFLITPLPSPS